MSSKDKLKERGSKFSLVLNDNELNLLKSPKYIVNKIMCDTKPIKFIAVIKHERDRREDDKSSLKTPHYHMVLQLEARCEVQTTLNWLSDLFHVNQNQIQIEKCNSIEGATRYLGHLDELDKEIYTIDEIETGFGMRGTLQRYFNLVKISDLADLVQLVKHYNYDLETIMTTIADYDNWRKYISDLLVEHHRRKF